LSKKIEEKKQKGLLIFASATFSMVEEENRLSDLKNVTIVQLD
jgi:hypothetical protein